MSDSVKIALAMIVKGDDKEAELLNRCLNSVAPYVDGIFITRTHKKGEKPNKRVKEVAKFHGAEVSDYEWTYDFADARNFNFSQVPKEYSHIMWADADDIFRGLHNLRKILKDYPRVDAFSINYLYDFDEDKMPTVVHIKTQVLKNNGAVEWAGKLHEDFKENRQVERHFIKDIERLHLSTEERWNAAKDRNVEVSYKDVEENPEDPRSYWNLGNSLYGAGDYTKAIEVLNRFLELSGSEEEKYIVRLRLASCEEALGNKNAALDHVRYAIGLRPNYPDAYHDLGRIYFDMGAFEKAAEAIKSGLVKRPPYYSIIVYNPRDYDYNPLMLLAKTYFRLSLPNLALECLKGCLKISQNEGLKKLIKDMEKEAKKVDKVLKKIETLRKITDKKKLKAELEKLPPEMQSHPGVCRLRNIHFVKEESSGKDLVYFCGFTETEWNPEIMEKKGLGGSEEAVINLSKEWAKKGWNVTVYNNCGHEVKEYDGVTYKPFWMWNAKDKQDVTILWRQIKPVEFEINSDKIYIDLHDVVADGEFTEDRMQYVDKVFVKTKFHRSLLPSISDDKIEIVPNGMDFGLFDQKVKKDQYLIVNTSSPDRSLGVLPELFERVKERVPEAKCKWVYGWEIFDVVHAEDSHMMQWKQDVVKAMERAGIQNLGRVTQKEAAKLYLEGNVLGYPTEFAEIDCITVKKAQACGCIPITTDFGALEESVQYGVKIHSEKTKENWCPPGKFEFGMEGEEAKQAWVDAVVKELTTPMKPRKEMKEWSKKFEWPKIATAWHKVMIK